MLNPVTNIAISPKYTEVANFRLLDPNTGLYSYKNFRQQATPAKVLGAKTIIEVLAKSLVCVYCQISLNSSNYSIDHLHPKSKPHTYKGNPIALEYGFYAKKYGSKKDRYITNVVTDYFNLLPACRVCNAKAGDDIAKVIDGKEHDIFDLYSKACEMPSQYQIAQTFKHYFEYNPEHKLFRSMIGLDGTKNMKLSAKLTSMVDRGLLH